MSTRSRALWAVAVLSLADHAPAHADIGFYEEGGMGTAHARGGLDAFEDGGFAVRAAMGYRRGHWGGELFTNSAELSDDTGFYTAMTVGPMLTARAVITRTQMDKHFARWLEVYGRVGPTHTWMFGDPGIGPPDGTRGFGFAGGGGLRWVYAAIGFTFDISYVHANLHKDRVHDERDELGIRDLPAVDLEGHIITTTLGIGFVI